MKQKKVIYIAGPTTGEPNYKEAFTQAEADLVALGCNVLNPAVLPEGMTKAQYMRICFSMLDCADAIVLLPGWGVSDGASLEKEYARYTEIPRVTYRVKSPLGNHVMDDTERRAWLYCGLTDAFSWAPKQKGVLY